MHILRHLKVDILSHLWSYSGEGVKVTTQTRATRSDIMALKNKNIMIITLLLLSTHKVLQRAEETQICDQDVEQSLL